MEKNGKWVLWSIVSLLALLFPAAAGAQETHRADLSGYNEVPSVSTPAEGTLVLRVAADEQSIEYSLEYTGISGGATLAAHIHLGQQHVNGGVSVFLCGGGGRPACTSLSGSFEGTITAANVIGPVGQGIDPGQLDELIRGLRAGATYVNVHSTRWPGGETRGQISGQSNSK